MVFKNLRKFIHFPPFFFKTKATLPNESNKTELPSLNHDLLYEILLKSLTGLSKNEEKIFIKFMLAGKQTFKVVENIFRKSKKIEICSSFIIINFDKYLCQNYELIENNKMNPPQNFKKEITKSYNFDYESPLMQPLLPIIFFSAIEVDISVMISSSIFETKKINFDKFFNISNIKILSFTYLHEVPEDIKNIIRKNKTIQILNAESSSLSKLLFISPTCQEIKIKKLYNFEDFSLNPKSLNLVFKNIKKLNILKAEMNHKFTYEEFKLFPCFIAKNFPKLETFNINVEIHYRLFEKEFTLENIQKLNADLFSKIPKTAKGNIQFGQTFFKNFRVEMGFISAARKEPNFQVNDSKGKTIITKEFEIHKDLTFKFYINFRQPGPSGVQIHRFFMK